MTPERYQRICQLFDEALERASGERAAFLAEACGADVELRAAVEKFLTGMAPAEDYLSRPALDVAAALLAQQQQPSALGKQISHYQTLSLLGAGGMGRVYLARDTRLQRMVALKMLPTRFTQDAERVRRFQTEAQAASALNHPNILTIYDVGETDGAHFIATEYVEGQTLRQLLQSGPLPFAQVIEIATQLADALSAAHTAGIIHRDIKPENVMRRPDGYVKVLDFGLAKLTEKQTPHSALRIPPSTEPGKVMGTISYMSPEQALGQSLDQRTDIFSLGVVLYELLSGVQPFKGDSEAATYNAILNLAPPALTETLANLPPAFAALIERCLEKDRALRYQTTADLRAALKGWQRDSSSHSAAVAVPSRPTPRWARVGLALGAAALLSAAAFFVFNKSKSQTAPPAVQTVPATFTQLTDQPGQELYPRLSPDGKTLLYASPAAGNWDLYARPLSGGEAVNLTKDFSEDDAQPAYSPDGAQIAFRSERAGGGLFVMPAQGGAARRVSDAGFNPAWSPDSRELAYSEDHFDEPSNRPIVPAQLFAVQLATGQRRVVTPGDAAQPSWSPHGQRIAYWSVQKGGQRDLFTVAASGGASTPVTDDAAFDWNPVWSPDGRYLYFASDRGGTMNVWRSAIEEATGRVLGAPEAVTTPSANSGWLSFDATGKQLVYVQKNSRVNLQKVAFDPQTEKVTSAPVWITRGAKLTTNPDVSPDGQWLVYGNLGDQQEDLYLCKTDGTGVRQLTNDRYKDRIPRWSPDGQRILFLSDRSGRYEAWVINIAGTGVDGAGLRQLTWTTGPQVQRPIWSADGKRILCNRQSGDPFIIEVDQPWQAQTPQPVTAKNELNQWPFAQSWTRDGQRLAVRLRNHGQGSEQSAIVVYDFATQLYDRLTAFGVWPSWLNDERRILFHQRDQAYVVDSQTKRLHSILSVAPNQLQSIVPSPDNRVLYFELAITEADIWLMKL